MSNPVIAVRQHFENATPGATYTLLNAPSPDDQAWRIDSTGYTITYDNTQAMHGTGSIKWTPGGSAGTGNIILGGYTGTNSKYTGTDTIMNQRAYFRFTGWPAGPIRIMEVRAQGLASFGGINIGSDGRVALAGPSGTIQQQTSGNALSLNTWYRFEQCWQVGTTSATLLCGVYLGDSTSTVTGFPYYSGTLDMSAYTNLTYGLFGKMGSSYTMAQFWADDFAMMNPTSPGLLGPYVPPPMANVIESVGIVLVDATGSVAGNGGTLSYDIQPQTNVSPSTAPGIWRVNQTSADQTFTVTVTETPSGRTGTATVVVPKAKQNISMKHYTGTAWV